MNSAEKKVFHIAVALFIVGLVVRFLPWGIPSIEQDDDLFGRETAVASVARSGSGGKSVPEVTDKVIKKEETGETVPQKKKKRKGGKKKGKVVRLPIHINRASKDELCALKGVGPKLAEQIIAFREQKGPFLTPADLEKVPGIGKKKAEGILQGVIFD